jgi:hypothetical protein
MKTRPAGLINEALNYFFSLFFRDELKKTNRKFCASHVIKEHICQAPEKFIKKIVNILKIAYWQLTQWLKTGVGPLSALKFCSRKYHHRRDMIHLDEKLLLDA